MTDLEVMRDIISTLDSISVPVALTQQIAVPLADASAEAAAGAGKRGVTICSR